MLVVRTAARGEGTAPARWFQSLRRDACRSDARARARAAGPSRCSNPSGGMLVVRTRIIDELRPLLMEFQSLRRDACRSDASRFRARSAMSRFQSLRRDACRSDATIVLIATGVYTSSNPSGGMLVVR